MGVEGQPVKRLRRSWPWALVGLLLVGLWTILLFQSDWKATDRLLGSAMRDLELAAASANDGDLAAAASAAERAHAAATAATERTDGPLWWLVGATTPLGPNLEMARHLVVAAEATSAAVVGRTCDDVADLDHAVTQLMGTSDGNVPVSLRTARADLWRLAESLRRAVAAESDCD